MRIVDDFAVMNDRQGSLDRTIRQASDGSGDQQLFTGRQYRSTGLHISDSAQGQGKQLIGSEGIIRLGLFCRYTGARVQAIGKISFRVEIIKMDDRRSNLLGQILP